MVAYPFAPLCGWGPAHRLLRAVWSVFIGIEPCHLDTSKKTVPPECRPKGLFGRCRAAFGATEEQGRGALHHHFIVWGDVPPEVVQAHFPRFWAAVQHCMDTMFVAEIPSEVHIADILRRHLNIPGHRWAFHDIVMPDDPDFATKVAMQAVQSNLHVKHCWTCKYGGTLVISLFCSFACLLHCLFCSAFVFALSVRHPYSIWFRSS